MPSYDVKDGYVVYTANPGYPGFGTFWPGIHEAAKQTAYAVSGMVIPKTSAEIEEIGDHLIALGAQEMAKDQMLLEKYGFKPTEDIGEFVRNFNSVLLGVDSFGKLVQRLQKAKDLKKSRDSSSNDKDKKKRQLANNFSASYQSQFITTFGHAAEEIVRKNASSFLTGEGVDSIKPLLAEAYAQSINGAFRELIANVNASNSQGVTDIYGNYGDYQQLLEIWDSSQELQSTFLNLLSQALPFDKIFNSIKSSRESLYKKRNNKVKTGMYTALTSGAIKTSQTGQIGGQAYEFQNVMEQEYGLTMDVTSGAKVSGNVNLNKMQKIDTTVVLSFDPSSNLDSLVADMNESINSVDLIDASEQISKFWEEKLSKVKDGFVIFSSAKNYGATSGAFHNDSNRPLSQLPDVVDGSVISTEEARNLVAVAYNSMSGALLSDRRSDVIDNIKLALAQSMARLFFDDWVAIGDNAGDTKAIHVFSLNGLQVPLSVLLKSAGQAIKDVGMDSNKMKSYFNPTVTIPESIKWPGDGEERWGKYPQLTSVNGKSHPDVEAAWEEQKEAARSGSSFSTKFLGNFWSIIAGYVGVS